MPVTGYLGGIKLQGLFDQVAKIFFTLVLFGDIGAGSMHWLYYAGLGGSQIRSASVRASYHPQGLHATRYVDPRLALVGMLSLPLTL